MLPGNPVEHAGARRRRDWPPGVLHRQNDSGQATSLTELPRLSLANIEISANKFKRFDDLEPTSTAIQLVGEN